MAVKISKGNETLLVDETCLEHWQQAGWKAVTDEKQKGADKK